MSERENLLNNLKIDRSAEPSESDSPNKLLLLGVAVVLVGFFWWLFLSDDEFKDLSGTNISARLEDGSRIVSSNLIKKNTVEIKSDIIEHLWKVIISDNTIDQYESNLMRRICGLIYFPDKLSAEIKLRILNKE